MPQRVLLLGATGTIGRATARALVRQGHEVVCVVRPGAAGAGASAALAAAPAVPESGGSRGAMTRSAPALPAGTTVRQADVRSAVSLQRDAVRGERFDALVSCLASRTGAPRDAWAIDHQAQLHALAAAQAAGARQMVLLSALCVQKPLLAFQQAKLAFEAALQQSGLHYSIVRPTAFFKSLSGQLERLRQGKPFLVFGDGTLTACKPIGDDDLADYIAGCLTDPARLDRILPIGGPGPAITPREQGELLFQQLGRPARFKQVPVALLDAIVGTLGAVGRVLPAAAAKAELARIGRYYATESMLVLDAASGRYSAALTPSFGAQTLAAHYRALIDGTARDDRGAHAVF